MVLEEFVGRARLKVILFAYCMLKGQFRKGADLRNVIFICVSSILLESFHPDVLHALNLRKEPFCEHIFCLVNSNRHGLPGHLTGLGSSLRL